MVSITALLVVNQFAHKPFSAELTILRTVGVTTLPVGEKCIERYIGETDRTLESRFHVNTDRPEHKVSIDNVKILDRDPNWFTSI